MNVVLNSQTWQWKTHTTYCRLFSELSSKYLKANPVDLGDLTIDVKNPTSVLGQTVSGLIHTAMDPPPMQVSGWVMHAWAKSPKPTHWFRDALVSIPLPFCIEQRKQQRSTTVIHRQGLIYILVLKWSKPFHLKESSPHSLEQVLLSFQNLCRLQDWTGAENYCCKLKKQW